MLQDRASDIERCVTLDEEHSRLFGGYSDTNVLQILAGVAAGGEAQH